MKTLQTQFDTKRLSSAVATPTCSSCCCCCCCLATTLSTSSLLAQRINKESTEKQMPSSTILTVLAALFVPIVGVLVYFGFWTINTIFRTCTEKVYLGNTNTYTVCTNPASSWLIPLLIIVPFLVLWFLYRQVSIKNPLSRAVLVTSLVAVAFVAEFFGGAALILTGVGGIVYLCLVPVIIGWISVWYHNHIGAEVGTTPAAASAAAPIVREPGGIYPTATKGPLATHEDPTATPTPPTEPQEPPQQNPPAAGAQ